MREKKMLRRTAAGMIAAVLMAGGISTAYAAETPGLSLGNDGAVAAEISLLQPDSTYYFPVQYTREDGRLVQVRASEADALELEVRSGEALDGAEIRTWNGRCYVRLETAGTANATPPSSPCGMTRAGTRRHWTSLSQRVCVRRAFRRYRPGNPFRSEPICPFTP